MGALCIAYAPNNFTTWFEIILRALTRGAYILVREEGNTAKCSGRL